MSTGVYRVYNAPRIPAPRVVIGQTLDAPLQTAAVQPQRRDTFVTRLVPLGIAALLPLAAAFVPPPAIAMVARAQATAFPQLPEPIAPFLSQVGPDSPIPLSPVDTIERQAYPTQVLPEGIAPLIPVVVTYIAPPALAMSPRVQGAYLQPVLELVAPYLSANAPDAPIPLTPVATIGRPPYPPQDLPTGIAALIPAVQTYTPPAPMATPARAQAPALPQLTEPIAPFVTSNTTDTPLSFTIATVTRAAPPSTVQPTPGSAPLIPALTQYVPPAALARVHITARAATFPLSGAPIAAPIAYVPTKAALQLARAGYPVQSLRVYLVQPGGAAPVILDETGSPLFVASPEAAFRVTSAELPLMVWIDGEQLTAQEVEDALRAPSDKRALH